MSPDPLSSQRRATLGVIRLALLAGVLAFGAVTWFTHRGPEWSGGPRFVPEPLPTIALAVPVLAAIAIVFVRRAAFATTDPARYGSLCVVGWALGEAAALAGGVHYFLSNDPSRYLIGLFVMLLSFVLIPLRRP